MEWNTHSPFMHYGLNIQNVAITSNVYRKSRTMYSLLLLPLEHNYWAKKRWNHRVNSTHYSVTHNLLLWVTVASIWRSIEKQKIHCRHSPFSHIHPFSPLPISIYLCDCVACMVMSRYHHQSSWVCADSDCIDRKKRKTFFESESWIFFLFFLLLFGQCVRMWGFFFLFTWIVHRFFVTDLFIQSFISSIHCYFSLIFYCFVFESLFGSIQPIIICFAKINMNSKTGQCINHNAWYSRWWFKKRRNDDEEEDPNIYEKQKKYHY